LQVVLKEAVEEYYARAVSLKTIEAILVSHRKSRGEERRGEKVAYMTIQQRSNTPPSSSRRPRMRADCSAATAVISQFAHTDIRADTKLGVKHSARTLYGNAAIEQYQCTRIEQMNKIEGTTEFGADAARVVLLGQVEQVHNGWKFMVPPVKILLNGFDSVGCQTWEGHVDVQDVAFKNGDLDHLDFNHILKISTSRAFNDIETPFTWYVPFITRQVADGGRDPSTEEDESAPGSLSARPSFLTQGGRTIDSMDLETSAQTDTELNVYQNHSRAAHDVVHRNDCAEG
jgi:hypothetical protein